MYRANVVYRGLSTARYDLHTSLFRLRGNASGEVEKHLLRNFRKYAHRDTSPGDWDWNWLSVGQHHGLPTRLLDWTFSPYVALHFATSNRQHFHRDAAVWCVDYVATHKLLPPPLYGQVEALGGGLFTTEMLFNAAKNLEAFDKYRDLRDRGLLVFFEPPSLDDRIVNQAAVFSAISDPTACLSDWLREHSDLYRKVVIPHDIKWVVRNHLDQANVTERVLFPGLDGLSDWLLRYYGERPITHPQAPGAPGPN
ncbi:FRG domain-containing protein [Streptomyces griseosporeus]|uniref:FRG domain-containing protein n=1 Tax=Streptomyces griseosporeus TaxID=1910 RepID=UPI001E5E895F|nr:FRG domain-containing protein [Streptomyces griseosporeus]